MRLAADQKADVAKSLSQKSDGLVFLKGRGDQSAWDSYLLA